MFSNASFLNARRRLPENGTVAAHTPDKDVRGTPLLLLHTSAPSRQPTRQVAQVFTS